MQDYTVPLTLRFFRDSGTKYIFKALAVENVKAPEVLKTLDNFKTRIANVKGGQPDQDLIDDIKRASWYSMKMPAFTEPIIKQCQKGGTDWLELKADKLKGLGRFIRYRIGSRILEDHDGSTLTLYGVWFAIETNTGDNSRGLITEIQKGSDVNPKEREEALKHKEEPLPNVYLQLPEKTTYSFECDLDLDEANGITFQCTLTLEVQKPNGDPIPVDLILDLGNSRTVALLLEHGSNEGFEANQFSDNCRPINLNPSFWKARIANYRKNDDSIINSSIVLQTPLFETGQINAMGDARAKDLYLDEWEFVPKKSSVAEKMEKVGNALSDVTKEKGVWAKLQKGIQQLTANTPVEYDVKTHIRRIPQMFVRLSPVLLGEEALGALNRSSEFQEADARFIQSSPKRYYWDLDTKAERTYWNMLPLPWQSFKITTDVPVLRCQLLRYMPVDGKILEELDYNPNAPQTSQFASGGENNGNPTYPRASSLTWMLLAILERAWEQMNLDTTNYRHKELNTIVITYPSGWLPCEVEMYRKRCEEAVNIFAKTNFDVEKQAKIRLEMKIDEAIASQMPFVFTEITQFGNAKHWIELMGKNRGGSTAVRIMNLDIGGGTTDFSIIEYCHRPLDAGTKLSIDLKFKDGFAVAGDHLLRILIDRVILAALRQSSKSLDKSIREHFKEGASTKTKDCLKRSMHVQRVLIPMAIHFLKLHNRHSTSYTFSAKDTGIVEGDWKSFLAYLNQEGQVPFDKMFNFNNDGMSHYIAELFENNFAICAKYATLYDVDLLVVSGKTSEIPDLTELIHKLFPLPADRIVSTKNYKTGRWYPHFDDASELNCISDAKTVTAVGAALHFALSHNLISNWKIENKRTNCDDTSSKNLWCTLGDQANDVDPSPSSLKIILKPNAEEGECHITNGTIFYRQSRIGAHPEPVFMFRNKTDNKDGNEYDVSIKRDTDEFGGETLTIISVYLHQDDAQNESADDYRALDSRENLAKNFEIVLHPAGRSGYAANWQESGLVIR